MSQPYHNQPPRKVPSDAEPMNPLLVSKLIGMAAMTFVLLILSSAATYVIEPGTRGLKVTLGKTADGFLPEGFGFKAPFVTSIVTVNVRQRTQAVKADCFSSDLQQVKIDLRVLYRAPESSVVQIYREFAGDPFDSLIAPRVQEAIKEVTALYTAEQIVKSREEIKTKALTAAKLKIGNLLLVEDIVVRDINLSPELEKAIEAKMVAEQQANQARFTQVQTQVEAETAVISAKGEAEAIRVREKSRFLGMWINADSSSFRSVPSFFALASSAPVADIVDERTAAIYEFGLDQLQLSPTGQIDQQQYDRFTHGLVDLRRRSGLFQQNEAGVGITEDVLYQARIALPSNVVVGRYVAETFAVRDGRVIASSSTEVQVRKGGFDRVVAEQSQENAFLYGLLAVALSVFMGWAAGRLYAVV